MSSFPVEIYHHILAQLPPLRDSDSSVYTLVNCSESNSILRCVSISAALWKSHYRIRYRHSNEREEEERRSKTGSDWRVMYIERRRLESQVLDTMKDVILGNIESLRPAGEEEEHDGHPVPWLQVVGRSTVQFGMDIYDMLDILQRTAPRRLRGAPEEAELAHRQPTSPWESWAVYLKGLVLRYDAISRWVRMKNNPVEMTFEGVLAGLSAFYGVSSLEISDTLDSLASECRALFVPFCVPIPENPAELRPDDVIGICERVCGFMRSKGFGPCHSLVPPEDLFPHRFISIPAARANIPMALVYVFVAICRRFNIAASATNFPSRVLAHVAPGGGLPEFWVDVFNSGMRPILQRGDVLQIWNRTATFPRSFTWFTEPCTPEASLIRQANNIMASIQRTPLASSGPRSSTIYPAASILCFLDTMQWPTGFGIVPDIDLEAVLGDLVAPRLPPDNRFHAILKAWTSWDALAYFVGRRGEHLPTIPKYFVGMVLRADSFTAACVIDWITPLSGQTDILYKLQIPIEGDPCGEIGYLLETQLNPAYSTSAFDQVRNVSWLGLYFSGVETNSEGLMRFIMNPTLRRRYPDDDEFGKKWLEDQGRKIG